MRDSDGGYVVNIISGAGLAGGAPYMSQYDAAKAGLHNLTESMGDEWKEQEIRVNSVSPGAIAMPGMADSLDIEPEESPPREQVDRPSGHPQETANLVQFLCSPAASYLNGSLIEAGLPSSEDKEGGTAE